MRNVEKKFRHLKIKENKVTSSETNKKIRDKNKDNDVYRLKQLLQQAKIRAKKNNLICDITIDDLLELFPKNKKCPVLNIDLKWGSSGKGDRWRSPSLDRINPVGNYTKNNIKIISWRANKIKGDCSIEEIELVARYMKS